MGLLLSGKYPTLAQLNKDTQLTYHLGYTIIEYIRDTWGMTAVRDLITSSGNLPAVLGKNESEFEKGWYEYVKGKYLKTT
jgi:membrane peptidoglycan carboxypeptidase